MQRGELLKKEIARLKITAERHEAQQYEQLESYKAEKAREQALLTPADP